MTEPCEIRAEDIRDGGLCPLCNEPAAAHRPQLIPIDTGDAIAGERLTVIHGHCARWGAENRRAHHGVGNVSLLGALGFAAREIVRARGNIRVWRNA